VARIGVDLGGTKIYGVVVDGVEVLATAKRKTPREATPDEVIHRIVRVVEDLGGVEGIESIGVGAPGPVDASGTVLVAPNLTGWDGPVPLAALLAQSLHRPVTVENDVSAATFAEHRAGAARGVADVLGVWVGTGVGGGLVIGGRLVRGERGGAAEIGHMAVRPGGRRCGCGGSGHLEAYAGRAGMEAEARRRHAAGEPTQLVEEAGDRRITSRVWADALAAGDVVATEIVAEGAEMLAVALASAAALVDMTAVVIGGGLAERLGDPWREEVARRLGDLSFGPPPSVVAAVLGDPGGALGAALLAG
jgi:glucokinase